MCPLLMLALFCIFTRTVFAAQQRAELLFEHGHQDSPLLRLDYGTYRGYYNSTNEVYQFKNIRFAAPPVGDLRWAKPAPPAKMSEIQGGRDGSACTQGRGGSPMTGREDCLFLDLTIPSKVFANPQIKVPVLVWLYGGSYVAGTKDSRDGHEFIKASGGNMMAISANYRVGLYGFLAGSTVEREGVPNAGIWDQHAAFEWVQRYISDIGGNRNQVTAMGISAGAGSLLHHLVLKGGKMDPLFHRAILQSPGYGNTLDRAGKVEQKFKRIQEFAGCAGKGLPCMRGLTVTALQNVSQFANSGQPAGSSGWGPVPDGILLENTPTLEIAAGRYWKNIQSLISGYTIDEGSRFFDRSINTSALFDDYVRSPYDNRTEFDSIIKRAGQLYPAVESAGSPFKTTTERVSQYVSDSAFNCHNRLLNQAYPDRTYTYQASLGGGQHGADQGTTFFDPNTVANAQMPQSEKISRQAFQSYLVSHILNGNPNSSRNNATIEWPITSGLEGKALNGILDVKDLISPAGLTIITSSKLVKERCDYWTDVQREVQKNLARSG